MIIIFNPKEEHLLYDRKTLYNRQCFDLHHELNTGHGTGHCPAGIFKNIISNVTKNEEAGHGLVLSLQLESAIQQYQRCERKLGFTVTDIRGKVDTINEHIDNVLKDAPTKLQVSVNVADADWKKIQELFDQEHKWMLAKMQEHIREVNGMFVEERRRVQKRYKEYDGCYLGHYAQWFFWFFFVLGFFLFTCVIVMMVGKGLHWF